MHSSSRRSGESKKKKKIKKGGGGIRNYVNTEVGGRLFFNIV